MENQGFLEEKPNEVEKKAWIEPEMQELKLNTGFQKGSFGEGLGYNPLS
ncbi:MAG: hypothetical protein ACK4R6_11850 [Spirosomataceae bacterium]